MLAASNWGLESARRLALQQFGIAVVLVSTPLTLCAQTDISAGAMYTWQDAQPPGRNPSSPTSGIGGTSGGVTFGVGRMTRSLPRFGWRAELEIAQELPYQQANFREADRTGYRTRGTYDDTAVSILMRYRVIQNKLEALAGSSLVHATLTRELGSSGSPYSTLPNASEKSAALTVGVDALFPIYSGLLIAPQLRIRFVLRNDEPIFGAGSTQIRPAITARIQFR
jgi:hypothetical protein